MKIIEYDNLDTTGIKKSYQKLIHMLEQDDFASAEVKKLKPSGYYRAKLDYTNRLLFKIVDYQGEKYALILEVIRQHTYEKSKFLKGVTVQEDKFIVSTETIDSEPIAFINQNKPNIHILNKIISFDDDQQSIFQLNPPIIIIGSAGSGKTALTIEKMKQFTGNIAYITHSKFLAHHARELYYMNESIIEEDQQVTFLSYQEFLETIEVPSQKEISFADFKNWVTRFKSLTCIKNPQALFEEFKGIISGQNEEQAYLSRDEYLALGVKQSIFTYEEREAVYTLYEKYQHFLKETRCYDTNLLSFEYTQKTTPTYDFMVIDEVQDFTNIQLLLMLSTIKKTGQFILCGDSNQIVHPNFFSWAKVKTLCHQGKIDVDHNIVRILHTNYRCAKVITELSNLILKIKQLRFGSIDKESNYLVHTNASYEGSATLLHEKDNNTATLNKNSCKSTQYAVIVLHDGLKDKAKKVFQTPLVFSVHEAKGLEYNNIILYDFISSETKTFLDIVRDIPKTALSNTLQYNRAKDKSDRSLEVYKFYINALYVAITRGIKHIYWVESVKKHPFFDLLDLKLNLTDLAIDKKTSSIQEWQQEAQRLALQGKKEQAEAIQSQFIKKDNINWSVFTKESVLSLMDKVATGKASKQEHIDLLEYALIHQKTDLIYALAEHGLKAAHNKKKSLMLIDRKYYDVYRSTNLAQATAQINRYGVDVRNRFNQTLAMIAAYIGNKHLLSLAIASGADLSLLNSNEHTAFQIALHRAIFDSQYAEKQLPTIYYELASDSLDVQVDNRLIKIDQRKMEYFIFHVGMLLLMLDEYHRESGYVKILNSANLTKLLQRFPDTILPEYRKKRAYVSSILSKNEVDSNTPYNHKLFKRVRHGFYVINPALKVKIAGEWVLQPSNNNQIEHYQKRVERTMAAAD